MVVAIDLFHRKAECFPFGCQWVHADRLFSEVALLNPIAVYDDDKVVETIVLCCHGCLPVGTFLQLSISGEHKHSPVFASHSSRQGGTYANGKSVPEWSGIGLHTRQFVAIRMPVQSGKRIHKGV